MKSKRYLPSVRVFNNLRKFTEFFVNAALPSISTRLFASLMITLSLRTLRKGQFSVAYAISKTQRMSTLVYASCTASYRCFGNVIVRELGGVASRLA